MRSHLVFWLVLRTAFVKNSWISIIKIGCHLSVLKNSDRICRLLTYIDNLISLLVWILLRLLKDLHGSWNKSSGFWIDSHICRYFLNSLLRGWTASLRRLTKMSNICRSFGTCIIRLESSRDNIDVEKWRKHPEEWNVKWFDKIYRARTNSPTYLSS